MVVSKRVQMEVKIQTAAHSLLNDFALTASVKSLCTRNVIARVSKAREYSGVSIRTWVAHVLSYIHSHREKL